MPRLPFSGRSSGASLRVTGGDRFYRLTSRLADPIFLARAGAKVLRRRFLPALRSSAPVRTGRLRSSLSIEQRGVNVQLRGEGYGVFPLWQGRRFRHNIRFLFERNRSIISRDLKRELTRGV